jgi:hypothetical protein
MGEPLLRIVRGLAGVLFLLASALPAFGQGFRVENRIFAEDDTEPTTESTTIFYEDLIYDYLEAPKEITVFDRAGGRIVLLDQVRRVRTELTTRELEILSERLRHWAAGQPDEFLRFTAKPEFDEQYDSSTDELKLSSPWLSYRIETTEPARSEIHRQYQEFCDWYCLLNTRLNPGSRPPFPRMVLNNALGRLGRLPRDVYLTVLPEGDKFLGEKISVRSEHRFIPHLVESDRSRVAQTDQFMAMYRPLPFREYQARIQAGR